MSVYDHLDVVCQRKPHVIYCAIYRIIVCDAVKETIDNSLCNKEQNEHTSFLAIGTR